MDQPEQIIALVRHGETEWNRQHRWQGRAGAPLNDLGRRQAEAAAEPLRRILPDGREWSWMITSPLERAVQTGEQITRSLPVMPVGTDTDLVERDYGVADGMLATEAAQRWPDGNFPEMETDQQIRARGARAIRRIAAAHEGDGIVVAHGSLIRMLISELCRTEAPRILNGAVNLIGSDGRDWELLEHNLVGELPVDEVEIA
ncbi:histidine phosphatase family protein [Microlunatus soli]|uniref:Probable phosphoglycerate mutase n=1 Tax=Microlunatus soli TaxID=630515 RepID=A0A1H2A959_9ACTN|nr:histidine phosphatase family protein [Microlunatus soli]SDT42302.1 probable phosphoglycerate mutase [Microlunatus soli]